MSILKEIISAALILSGVLFMIISAVGLIRLPDFYIRNSASTKAATLGLGLILLGTGVYFNDIQVFLELFAILFFIVLIAPLAAHIVSRAAFKTKVPFWKNTDLSEIEGGKRKDADDETSEEASKKPDD